MPELGHVSLKPRDELPLWVQIVGIPLGAAIAVFFGWCLWYEMRQPPTHTTHIVIFSLGVLLGLLVAFGRWYLFPVISQTIVLYGDYKSGGRRRNDPPARGEGA